MRFKLIKAFSKKDSDIICLFNRRLFVDAIPIPVYRVSLVQPHAGLVSKLEICHAEKSISLYQANDVYSHSILIPVASYFEQIIGYSRVIHKTYERLSVTTYLKYPGE
jgi:hypothetical protein